MRAAYAKIKNHRRRHDGYHAYANIRAEIFFFKILHCAGGRIQPICAAAREHHRLNAFHNVIPAQKIRFPRSGCAAAHIHASDRASLE